MATLPEDVIVNILSWLPVKDLLKFRCVSKSFRALISDPHFIKTHLNRSISSHKLGLIINSGSNLFHLKIPNNVHKSSNTKNSLVSTNLDLSFKGSPISVRQILGFCDGLLCFVTNTCNVFLLNPFTRDLTTLPELPEFPDSGHLYSSIWGFGYCSKTRIFKVLTIMYFKANWVSTDKQARVLVHTIGSNSWRIGAKPAAQLYSGTQIVVNGAPHWRATGISGSDNSVKIVAFDVENEKFYELDYPESRDGRFSMDSLGVLKGCLCVFRSFCSGDVEVWVMEEYGIKESWKRRFSMKELVLGNDSRLIAHQPLWFLPNGEVLLALCYDEKMVLYDPCSGVGRDVRIPGVEGWFEALVCVESLVSLKGESG